MQITKLIYASSVKYDFHCADFHETHDFSTTICKETLYRIS